jgi:glyoxylase-like metal-dependent hydrolase (beta-lactamase superfamily II)
LAYVAETHLHNDYVSGGLELAWRTGAATENPRFHEYDRVPASHSVEDLLAKSIAIRQRSFGLPRLSAVGADRRQASVLVVTRSPPPSRRR